MSREIDDRVVSMQFDNANFERNVRTSMSTLEKLKQALTFKGATKGIEAVETASKKVNFSGMANAVDEIGVRFSSMQVIATTALANITNAAVNAGKQIVSALTIDPIKGGFSEYETQIGAIQTILSNTRHEGTNLEQVNSALDELNTYADKTIYNFTEMTKNIGTFTAAGVSLDTSVAAIKGIANLAAASGSTSAQAASAMYQLSQALAAGRVSLMDWNSVVNAGMGGKLFQDALIRTSELMGTGAKQAIETYGSFRESLTKGQWLTTDVLTETLKQISGAYTEAELISQGYTQQQAADIMSLAKDAEGAATNVRTFSQLIDTTMEALGSGWSQTWEILVGDFEEAKTLFSDISKVVNNAVEESATARNNMLTSWKAMGGRDILIEGLRNAFEGLLSVITPIREAFEDVFPPMTGMKLLKITEAFRDFTENLKLSGGQAQYVKDIFSGLFSILKTVGTVIATVVKGIATFVSNASGGIDNVLKFGSAIGNFFTNIGEAITQTGALGAVVDTLASAFGQAFTALTNFLNGGVSKMGDMFSGVGDILGRAADVIVNAVTNIATGIRDILGTADFGSLIDVFNSGMLAALITSVNGWFRKLTGGIEDSSSGLFDTIRDMVSGISDSVSDVLDSVRGSLEAWQTNIKADILLKIATAVAILVAAITVLASINPDRLTDSLGALTVVFAELLGAMSLFTKLNTTFEQLSGIGTMIAMATAIAILAGAMKSLAELDADQIERGVLGVAGLATVMTLVSKALSNGGAIARGSVQLILMAAALKVLASVAKDMGSLDFDTMEQGLIGIAGLMGTLVIFSQTVKSQGLLKVSASMVIMAGALEVLIDVVGKFGSMDIASLGVGLGAIGAVMGEFAIFTRLLPKGSTLLKAAGGILLLSVAFAALEPVMASFAKLGLEGVSTGLLGIAGVLQALTRFLQPMLSLNITDMAGLMWAIPELIGSLQSIADAMTSMAGLSVTDIAGSLITMTVSFKLLMKMIEQLDKMDIGDMAALAIAMPMVTESLKAVAEAISMLSGIGFEGSISAVAAFGGAMKSLEIGLEAVKGHVTSVGALMLVSVALVALATAITLISNSGIIGVVTSFIALAGAMTIIGTATKILKPLIPTMYSFAGSIAAFGASLVALGVGTAATGAGLIFLLTGLAGAIVALTAINPLKAAQGIIILAGAFTTIGVAAKLLKPLIPSILQLSMSVASLGVSCIAVSAGIALLVAGLTALGSIGQEGAAAIVDTLKSLVIGISQAIPEIITSLMESFKTILLGLLDVLVEVAPQIADSFLQVMTETLSSMVEYGPQMAGFFIDFLIAMLNTVTERIPELVPAVSNLVKSLFTEISKALSSWSGAGDAFTTGISVLGGLSALVVAFNAIRSMIPGAMIGAVQMAAFVVEVGAILTALGALEQLTNASSFISSGGDLLQSIGTAIGQFIGGIVGGIAEGATSTLPQIGTSLSQFGVNVLPFLTAMKMVDQETIDGVTNLALAITALSGANFVDAVATFLSGGQDFGDLGSKLIPFGEAVVEFSQVVSGIDVGAVTAAAQCGQALAALATSLPKEGGLTQAIFGETTDMAAFGTQLVAFGSALLAYSTAVSGIQVEPIMQSAQAGQALSELAASLPKEGGLAQAIFGDTIDMATFGSQLLLFGTALQLYSGAVANLDVEAINNSAQAGQALSNLASSLPDDGGIAEWLFGGSDLGSFGDTLVAFGNALVGFSNSLVDVNISSINSSVSAVQSLKQVLTDFSGLDTSGIENLASIRDIGTALGDYYAAISSYDVVALANSVSTLISIKDLINGLAGIDTSGISSFSEAITQLGQISLDGLVSTFSNADLSGAGLNLANSFATGFQQGLTSITTAVTNMISSVTTSISGQTQSFSTAGQLSSTAYATGIQNGVSEVTSAVQSMVTSAASALGDNYQSFFSAGSYLAQGFAAGIRSSAFASRLAAQAMANAAANAAAAALDEHSPSKVMEKIGSYAGQGFVNGMAALVGESQKVGTDMAEAVISGVSVVSDLLGASEVTDQLMTSLRELSDSLSTAKEETSKNTEEASDSTSKLSEALSSMANSLAEVSSHKKDLKAITSILKRTGVTFTQDFIDEMLDSSGQFVGALTEMSNLTDENLQLIVDSFEESKIYESVMEIVDSLSEDDGLIDALVSSGRSIEQFAKDISDFGLDVDTVANKITEFSDQVSDGFNKMEVDGQTTFEEFRQNLNDNLVAAMEWQKNLEIVLKKMGTGDAADAFRKELLEGGFEKYGQIVADLAQASQYEIAQFLDFWDYAKDKANEISGEVVSDLIPEDDRFIKSGKNITSGIAKGIESGTSKVTGAVQTLCTSIESTINSYFGIASPSKLMIKTAGFMVRGLSKGFEKDSKLAVDSVTVLCDSVWDAINSISDPSIEIHPKIVPVVDSTDALDKLALLNSNFANQPSSYVMGMVDTVSQISQNGTNMSMVSLRDAINNLGNKIDSIDPENFGITYQQNNYSPKALSSAEIYRKTKSQLSKYKSHYNGTSQLL